MSDGLYDILRAQMPEDEARNLYNSVIGSMRNPIGPVSPASEQYATGTMRGVSRMPPISEQYRATEPTLPQRFADNFLATPNLTENLALMAAQADPSRVRQVRAARQARAEQYAPDGFGDQAAEFIGGATKQVVDPVGILAAVLTKNYRQAAGAGGAYEAGASATTDITEGENVDYKNAAIRGTAGAIGAGFADKLVGGHGGGVVPELIGRVLGAGVLSERIENEVNAALTRYYETNDDAHLTFALDLIESAEAGAN